MRNKLDSIQFFRFVAIFLVVYTHSFDRLERYVELDEYVFLSSLAYFGRSGVDLFFVISGFIMMYITYDNMYNGFHWKKFMLKRIVRIVPIYWMVTLVVLVLINVNKSLFYNTSTDIWHSIGSFLFLPISSPDGKFAPLLGVGWTLNLEMYFYFIFSVFLFYFKNKFLYLLFAFVSLCIMVSHVAGNRNSSYFYSLITNPILFEFFMGVLIFYLYKYNNINKSLLFILLFISCLVIIFTMIFKLDDEFRFIYWGGAYSIVILCLLRFCSEVKYNSLLIKIGDASFSIYLIHYFVISGLYFILNKFRFDFYHCGVFIIPLVMILSLYIGFYFYKYIELNANLFVKKVIKV